MKTFLFKHPKIDAVFFATNYLGIQGLKVLKEVGKRIPDDMSVLSFDDHDIFKLYSPAIMVINQPIAEMGEKGIEMLVRQMDGTGKLIMRESV
jgi:LacI family transcriptional regulator